ncbi:MAG: ABC transporter substrate-binding protein, partial [Pseudomonadota bacterium]
MVVASNRFSLSATRRHVIGALVGFAAALTLSPAPIQAAEPVIIGELNSYTRLPAFTEPYRKGWQLALDEINQSGGVLGGRPLEVISRDDGGTPADA